MAAAQSGVELLALGVPSVTCTCIIPLKRNTIRAALINPPHPSGERDSSMCLADLASSFSTHTVTGDGDDGSTLHGQVTISKGTERTLEKFHFEEMEQAATVLLGQTPLEGIGRGRGLFSFRAGVVHGLQLCPFQISNLYLRLEASISSR